MAHYLTFNTTSGVTIKVNNTTVSSGYQLQNGDIITVDGDSNNHYCHVNNGAISYYYPGNVGTINISDQDINIRTGYGGGSND